MTLSEIVIEIPEKLPRDKTVSTKITAYEHQLLKYLSETCNTTISTVVENAINLLIYTILYNSAQNIPGGPAWNKIIYDMGIKAHEFIKRCTPRKTA